MEKRNLAVMVCFLAWFHQNDVRTPRQVLPWYNHRPNISLVIFILVFSQKITWFFFVNASQTVAESCERSVPYIVTFETAGSKTCLICYDRSTENILYRKNMNKMRPNEDSLTVIFPLSLDLFSSLLLETCAGFEFYNVENIGQYLSYLQLPSPQSWHWLLD